MSARHDYRDPADDKHGKRNVAYPAGSKDYPTITETRTRTKGSVDRSADFGQAHFDARSFPACLLTKQETTPGDNNLNNEVSTYEKLPGPPLTTTRLDDDGNAVTVTRQRMAVGDIVTAETLGGSPIVWTRQSKGEGDLVAAEQITEARLVPGNHIGPFGSELDYDGQPIFTSKQRVSNAAGDGSAVVAGVWYRTTHEAITDLVTWEIIRTRPLPGDPVTTTKVDRESDQVYTETRTLKQLSTISEGITKVDGTSTTVTESQPIDEFVGYEVVTVYPQGDHVDKASAIVETEIQPFIFPTRVDVGNFLLVEGLPLGLRKPSSATVKHTIRTWWEISATEPTIAFDNIAYGDNMILPNGFSFGDCIHDDADINYGGIVTISYPATNPSWTTFVGSWVGTDRVIRGSVKRAGNKYRWKVQQISVPMQ